MYHCVNENYEEQITCKWDAVSSVLTNKAFGKHKASVPRPARRPPPPPTARAERRPCS